MIAAARERGPLCRERVLPRRQAEIDQLPCSILGQDGQVFGACLSPVLRFKLDLLTALVCVDHGELRQYIVQVLLLFAC